MEPGSLRKDNTGAVLRSRTMFFKKNYFCLFRWSHTRSAENRAVSECSTHVRGRHYPYSRQIGRTRDFPTPPRGGGRKRNGKGEGGGDIFWNTVGALGVIDLRFRNLTLTISPF